jgi:hypothetical protein
MDSNTNNNNNNNNNHNGGQKDLSSVLSHIESLQKQLAEKNTELSEVRQREEAAKNQVAQLNDLNEKLSEAKREAMREDFNNKVRGWIQSLDSKEVPDGVKQEFLDGAENFIKKGSDNGAWKVCFYCFLPYSIPISDCVPMTSPPTPFIPQVLCCASSIHQSQVNTIQKLTDDYNALKKTIDGGQFGGEDSRKRKEMEPSTTVAPAFGVWEQLEGICSRY